MVWLISVFFFGFFLFCLPFLIMPRRSQAQETASSSSSQRNGVQEEHAHEPSNWPGPFATARSLLKNRSKARKLRQEDHEEESNEEQTLSGRRIPWEPKPEAQIDSTKVDDGWCLVPDTYPVPSLTVLCIQFICKHIEDLEALGPVTSELRRKLSYTLCERQKMDAATFDLLCKADDGYGGGTYEDAIDIPDCALIDPPQMQASLQQCKKLRKLALGHCGRGFTDRTAKAIRNAVAPSLRSLSLRGAYALSSSGLYSFLQAAEQLRQLELAECPQIDMQTVARLPELLPHLDTIKLNSLHFELKDRIHPNAKKKGKNTGVSTSEKMDQWLSSLPVCIKVATLQNFWTANFKNLRSIHFSQLPQLDDYSIQLLASSQIYAALDTSPHVTLEELTIEGCPSITDASLNALSSATSACARCNQTPENVAPSGLPGRQWFKLRKLELKSLPGITDQGIKRLCECSFPLNRLVLAELAGVCEEQTIIDFLKSHPEGKSASNQRRSSSQVSIKGLETVELVSMKITNDTLLTLTDISAKTLHRLDISWCRSITDDALGHLVDTCQNLRQLEIWGNTQLTPRFFDGHRNDELTIIGRVGDKIPNTYEHY